MHAFRSIGLALAIGASFTLSACARTPTPPAGASTPLPPKASAATGANTTLPAVVVHKSPTCGCCGLWVDHLRAAGFAVEVRDHDNLNPIKERLGVPFGKGSCHTAEIDGYMIEGHVPVEDIRRLLVERPSARGLVLPGMPAGSPGMEMPDGRVQPYTVELVALDGSTRAYRHHPGSPGQ